MAYAMPSRGDRKRFGFRRDLLPSPGQYFRDHGIRFSGGLEWKSSDCPFCGVEKALLVRLDSGGHRCTACGAHGRDILAFHMKLSGLPFKKAARDLGAWREVDHA